MKKCRNCQTSKDEDQFYNKSTQCKACANTYSRLYYKVNREKISARDKARYEFQKAPMTNTIKELKTIMELRASMAHAITPESASQVMTADMRYQEFTKLLAFDVGRMLAEMQQHYESIIKESGKI